MNLRDLKEGRNYLIVALPGTIIESHYIGKLVKAGATAAFDSITVLKDGGFTSPGTTSMNNIYMSEIKCECVDPNDILKDLIK